MDFTLYFCVAAGSEARGHRALPRRTVDVGLIAVPFGRVARISFGRFPRRRPLPRMCRQPEPTSWPRPIRQSAIDPVQFGPCVGVGERLRGSFEIAAIGAFLVRIPSAFLSLQIWRYDGTFNAFRWRCYGRYFSLTRHGKGHYFSVGVDADFALPRAY